MSYGTQESFSERVKNFCEKRQSEEGAVSGNAGEKPYANGKRDAFGEVINFINALNLTNEYK